MSQMWDDGTFSPEAWVRQHERGITASELIDIFDKIRRDYPLEKMIVAFEFNPSDLPIILRRLKPMVAIGFPFGIKIVEDVNIIPGIFKIIYGDGRVEYADVG